MSASKPAVIIPSDYTLAKLCAQIYTEPASSWDNVWQADDIYLAHVMMEGVDIIVFRGSRTLADWLRDLDALPHKHPLLGWCHGGFLRYMDLVFEEVMSVVGRNIVVTGHSLGAARASILTGLLLAHGSEVEARVVFGEPRPGFNQLRTIIQQSRCQSRSYRNLEDPVPTVPVALGTLLRYVHPSEPLRLDESPVETIRQDLMRFHAIELYVRALGRLI